MAIKSFLLGQPNNNNCKCGQRAKPANNVPFHEERGGGREGGKNASTSNLPVNYSVHGSRIILQSCPYVGLRLWVRRTNRTNIQEHLGQEPWPVGRWCEMWIYFRFRRSIFSPCSASRSGMNFTKRRCLSPLMIMMISSNIEAAWKWEFAQSCRSYF